MAGVSPRQAMTRLCKFGMPTMERRSLPTRAIQIGSTLWPGRPMGSALPRQELIRLYAYGMLLLLGISLLVASTVTGFVGYHLRPMGSKSLVQVLRRR